jgi:hypothetical protein
MEIYIVTELNILASGEKEIYVTPFEFIADAEKEKERLTEEHNVIYGFILPPPPPLMKLTSFV